MPAPSWQGQNAPCPAASQPWIVSLSYVYPSPATTGSFISVFDKQQSSDSGGASVARRAMMPGDDGSSHGADAAEAADPLNVEPLDCRDSRPLL